MIKNVRFLYPLLSAAFCTIVVLSNLLSAKMVKILFFSEFAVPAGLITYPLTFLLSDFVTEIFGAKQSKQMVYIAFGMSLLSFLLIQIVLLLPSSDSQEAFKTVLGLSGVRIFSSLFAFVAAQLVDIKLYALIKRWTGLKFLWLRTNGSTWVAQLVDTVIIDLIYLYWGMGMDLASVLPIMLFSYTYKSACSVAVTPLFYLSLRIFKPKSPKEVRASRFALQLKKKHLKEAYKAAAADKKRLHEVQE